MLLFKFDDHDQSDPRTNSKMFLIRLWPERPSAEAATDAGVQPRSLDNRERRLQY